MGLRCHREIESVGGTNSSSNSHASGSRAARERCLTYGERINILFSAFAMVRRASWRLRISDNEVWETLTGEKPFVRPPQYITRTISAWPMSLRSCATIGIGSKDWLDGQGFLWIANDKTVAPPEGSDRTVGTAASPEASMAIEPVNLILYGPPAPVRPTRQWEAVACGEPVPTTGPVWLFPEACSGGRIEFVTFHQSLSYEEFSKAASQ
jgi:hypothetical protein